MSSDPDGPGRSVQLITITFLATAVFGSVLMLLVCALAPLAVQVAVLGAWISVLTGLALACRVRIADRRREREERILQLTPPDRLLQDPELSAQYLALCRYVSEVVRHDRTDTLFRDLAMRKLASVAGQVADVAQGRIVFASTERWPAAYAALLASREFNRYRAVAWIRDKRHAQDERGEREMQVNLEAVLDRMFIERTVIIRDELWKKGELLPFPEILRWIQQQHDHGIRIRLVRESALASESDLLVSMDIFGEWAVSTHELDERSRSLRTILEFDPQTVRSALIRWERLVRHASTFRSLLDQLPENG